MNNLFLKTTALVLFLLALIVGLMYCMTKEDIKIVEECSIELDESIDTEE